MFEITLETNRLKSMLSQALKLKSGVSPVDAVLITFTPNGATVRTALVADLYVFADYYKAFFKSIKVEGEEVEFMANTELVKKRLSTGFSGESITLRTDGEKIIITGSEVDDRVTQKLDAVDHSNDSPFSAQKTVIGLIPRKEDRIMTFNFTVLVPVEKFTDAIDYEEAILTVDENGKMFLNFEDELGDRKRPILYKEAKGTIQPTKVIFNFKTFQELMSMFKGEVWLSGDETKLVISQTNSDFSLTYAHAPKKEA